MTPLWGMLRELARALLLSLLDAYSGFSHLVLGEVAKELYTIATCLGLAQWEVLPQGPVNAPAEFQTAVHEVFAELIAEGTSAIHGIPLFFGKGPGESRIVNRIPFLSCLSEPVRRLIHDPRFEPVRMLVGADARIGDDEKDGAQNVGRKHAAQAR